METNAHNQSNFVPASILIAAAIIGGAILLRSDGEAATPPSGFSEKSRGRDETVAAVSLPIHWGALGQRMVSVGVLDREKFLGLYAGTQREIARRLIDEAQKEPIVVTKENAGVILHLLWGVGLGNKSAILEKGEMVNPRYGGASQLASTGGWTISDGNPMEHYSRHPFIVLTPEQEELVARVSEGIFRPCCDNSTHFPDCNHGMAMLGLLELLASQGATETELYDAALAANRLWFPDQYAVIGEYEAYMRGKGKTLTTQELVGRSAASASGFQRLAAERAQWGTPAPREERGGGCSV